ncbi:response regulator [Shimia sagamensis]|uniref:Response regulator receiver domain-containing protein n=1 Tax=Shimia sagamensis TaxID=1566352 RepID=A0ABY1NKQ4_9RHOB|nr:response regulator [Shimia sagamensis]SMP12285.1 Response regulator receiver domain-containing protein [Shimia sagamensis]
MQKVYIADDNVEFAEYLAHVATRHGWDAEICSNGIKLLEGLQEGDEPALLLVDINMPQMDGIEVISGLAALNRPLRLRFMTGGGAPSMEAAKLIAQARDIDVGDSMHKPLSRDLLKDVLQTEAGTLAQMQAQSL